jgi:hypothetical protein
MKLVPTKKFRPHKITQTCHRDKEWKRRGVQVLI